MEKEKSEVKIRTIDIRESFINVVIEYNKELYEGLLLKKGIAMNDETTKSMD